MIQAHHMTTIVTPAFPLCARTARTSSDTLSSSNTLTILKLYYSNYLLQYLLIKSATVHVKQQQNMPASGSYNGRSAERQLIKKQAMDR